MSAADVTPAFVAELRKTHEGKQSKLREHHPRGSWAWLALDILDLCDAIESAWAERDAYLDEVRMTNENEARIMADLIATREECDRLRSELARLRSAPVAVGAQGTPGYEWRSTLDRMPMDTWLICSNQDARLFWAKQAPRSGQWTFGGVGFRDPTHWLAPRLSLSPQPSAPVAVEVPEPTVQQWLHEVLDPAEADPDPHATMRHATRWFREHIRPIPSDRVLNDGEVAIRADVLSAMEGCIATLRADDELIPSKALAHLDALRSNGGEA